jgi:TRAP-type C4-dicarboxylate transport system substrate-binding protein
MLKKKVIAILLVFVVCMIAMSGISQADEAKYKIKIASHHPESHLAIEALKNIKETIERESNGEIEITIYPGSQLGDYTVIFEEVMRGSIEMAHICQTAQYDEKLEMNYMPYLITNYDQIPQVFTPGSYFFDKYAELNKNLGVKLLGIYVEGFPGLATRNSIPKEVGDPTVKKSELIRVPPMDIIKLAIQDMGYSTVTIPYADLFTALQTGVADGWFGGTPELNYLSFRDVIKYYIVVNESLENTSYLINEKFFDSLPEKYQKLIEDEFLQSALNSFKTCEDQDKLYMQKLADYGIEIINLSDEQRAVIAEHVREVTWPKLVNKFGKEIMEGLQADIK